MRPGDQTTDSAWPVRTDSPEAANSRLAEVKPPVRAITRPCWRWKWLLIPLLFSLAAVGLLAAYHADFGFPTTPMTTARANQIFGDALHCGDEGDEVKAWLESQGIPYDVLNRREQVTPSGWWMDCVGHQTVAECAGLRADSVFRVIRIRYPDAQRILAGHPQITVYIFFDSNDRLIKHWTHEFHIEL
jgi:hypothetical protein